MSWADFIKAETHRVEKIFHSYGVTDWAQAYRRRKWRFAGKIARCGDKRWTYCVLLWTSNPGQGRGVGRPATRWQDDICKYGGEDWIEVAADEAFWRLLEDGYVSRM